MDRLVEELHKEVPAPRAVAQHVGHAVCAGVEVGADTEIGELPCLARQVGDRQRVRRVGALEDDAVAGYRGGAAARADGEVVRDGLGDRVPRERVSATVVVAGGDLTRKEGDLAVALEVGRDDVAPVLHLRR